MLFNSYIFTLGFLPLILVAYHVARRYGASAQFAVLLFASWAFYAWWDIRFLPLLLASIGINYAAGLAIAGAVRAGADRRAGHLLTLGVTLNLAVIGVFKYANFFADSANAAFGADYVIGTIILPLGISFYTFEQIGFLVDTRRGQTVPQDLLRYALFVSFFPRLIAGPILRYNEIVPQWNATAGRRLAGDDVMIGLTIFFIGLAKKAVLADGIAPYAGPGFEAAANGEAVHFFTAWGAALAYTCQLYFDFSGYSDMAIGLARCFGVRFPMNFSSPYKATSIVEFWRRWHITLSRFLRDYLYIGLGGNRSGKIRRYANLMTTMLLGGLWHGANWTFVFWGGLHGFYLIVNYVWARLGDRHPGLQRFRTSRAGHLFGWTLTFLSVVTAWVFFRSPTFAGAWTMLEGMVGANGVVLPAGLAFALRPIDPILGAMGITFGAGSGSEFVFTYLWVAALLGLALFAPNTQQIMARYEPVLETHSLRPSRIGWSASPGWAVATAGIAFVGLISITRVSEFLYWQF